MQNWKIAQIQTGQQMQIFANAKKSGGNIKRNIHQYFDKFRKERARMQCHKHSGSISGTLALYIHTHTENNQSQAAGQ